MKVGSAAHHRWRGMVLAAAVVMTGAACAPTAPATPHRDGGAQIQILDSAFSPATVTIRAGQTVEWTNRDRAVHTVDLSGVVSNVLDLGATYTLRFTSSGTYPYSCSMHPSLRGEVVVRD